MNKYVTVTFTILFVCISSVTSADKLCVALPLPGRSVVCACNATYCDTITREAPREGRYIAYTTSEGGLRFNKTRGYVLTCGSTNEIDCLAPTLELVPSTQYQTIEGFGGAATDAAGINWKNLSDPLQKSLIDSYFSDSGIQYSMIRVPIGGSDFSTHAYAYNELPVNDTKLTNYTLTVEDYKYKIPLIKAAQQAASTPLHVVGTTWSPPRWMKTSNSFSGVGQLKTEYLQTYADYFYKFIDKYAAEGIPVWAITTTNEPTNGVISLNGLNCLGWSAKTMGDWIVNNLGPTIRNSIYKDVKILAVDDQRVSIPYWFNTMVKDQPKALEYIDGVAVHYYTDAFSPASILTETMKGHPDKLLLATEACEGSFPWQLKKVDLGSWARAKNYITDIISDLNHNVVGWIDWNLCLNSKGGPNWVKNFVDSPIIVFPKKNIFIKQPMFYGLGHFSKFIPRGSRRIQVNEKKSWLSHSIDNVAFVTPNNTIVSVLYNDGKETTVTIKLGNSMASVKLVARSVTTVEFLYQKE